MRTAVYLCAIAALLLLAGCLTPRQNEAVLVLSDLLADGVLTQVQFDALVAALSPGTWVQDVIEIGATILGGGGVGMLATNTLRNRARRRRGEPVTAAPMPA